MSPPNFRGAKPPGVHGLAQDPRTQHPSRFCGWPASEPGGTRCAQIFFATNEDTLHGEDLIVVQSVGRVLKYLKELGDTFVCTCEGHADSRHDPLYNEGLSDRRASAVADALRRELPSGCASWIEHRAFGESRARPSAEFWAEDRRVDVLVELRPGRLARASVSFEGNLDDDIEFVFIAGLGRLELQNGGRIKSWIRRELAVLWNEDIDKSKHVRNADSLIFERNAALSLDEYIKEHRSRVTACVRVEYGFVAPSNVHRVTATILDAVTLAPMFPAESVDAQRLVEAKGTYYLSSPEGSSQQIWRLIGEGQDAASGRPTRTISKAPDGLTGQLKILFDKLCAGFPNITQRVQSTLQGGTTP